MEFSLLQACAGHWETNQRRLEHLFAVMRGQSFVNARHVLMTFWVIFDDLFYLFWNKGEMN